MGEIEFSSSKVLPALCRVYELQFQKINQSVSRTRILYTETKHKVTVKVDVVLYREPVQ